MKRFFKILLVCIFIFFAMPTMAQEPGGSNKLSCRAKHLNTNEMVDVKTEPGLAINNKIATAQWPLGYPTIMIDNSAFVKLKDNVKQFIYYHECAHLTLQTKDEAVADCESIYTMINKHGASELDIRILVKNLAKEFGLSPRWTDLLNCENIE